MQTLRSKYLIGKLFCLILALAFCAPQFVLAQSGTQTQQLQPKLPPRQYISNRNYDTQHIKLDLRFDWEREQALGTATITFTPLTTNLQSVEFDAAHMTFSSVKLANGTPLNFEADAPKEKLRVMMDRAYQPTDVLTVVIAYNTNGVSTDTGIARRPAHFSISFRCPLDRSFDVQLRAQQLGRRSAGQTGRPARHKRHRASHQND